MLLVAGNQSQKIFLVSGIVGLASKVLLLVVAVTLAGSGLQGKVNARPILLFCFDENSTLLQNRTDVLPCTISKGDCQLKEEELAPKKRLQQSLAQLEEDWIEAEMTDLNITVDQIKKKKEELKESLEAAGYGRIQQKIRICEDDSTEFKIRVGLLSGLVVIVVLAALATYRLHEIADYKVKL